MTTLHRTVAPLFAAALAIAWSIAPSAPAQKQKAKDIERLEEAEKLLRGPKEEQVREGAHICRDVGDVKAVELLLRVLNETQPHFRDIVWEVLPDFKDAYARKRVEAELKTNAKNDDVREWCAELLGLYGDAALARPLEAALSDRADGVQRAAARSLGQLRYEPACEKLVKLATSKDVFLRANAIEALARIKPDVYRDTFRKGLDDPDAGVRCALLGELPKLDPDFVEEASVKALKDNDWRPRIQAVENLSKVRTKSSIDALIPMTADGRPVVKEKALVALRGLTGMKWTIRAQWADWWKDNREAFQVPDGLAAAPPASDSDAKYAHSYNQLPVFSDHIAFLIDKSADMTKKRTSDHRVKSEVALEELNKTLSHLGSDLWFDAFIYSTDVAAFKKNAVKLDDKERKAVISFISGAKESGSKNIWQALTTVMNNPELDTLFLLSSGEPEIGLYVHWNRVTAHLADLNRFHKVVIHTVAYSDSQWYRDQLQHIADVTGGIFKWFD
ncbi:MAG: HEAT repeat domain-containing protein [Planctomycetes bacterium]|nr:HEAT repeat domain-containing protein [Planctomycetota bacterium]MBI3845703.1 HEAT repeat domain-containing protein [Planctomycetota bacterium]